VADADFRVTAPSGGTAEVSPTSDINGAVLASNWTLGPTAGYQYLQLGLPDGRTFRDSILALPAAARDLIKVSGDGQSAPPNSTLPQLLIVRVVDQYGNGISNVAVQWSTCDGTDTPLELVTDEDGYSATQQNTGTQAGPGFCTKATASGLPGTSAQEFHYTVTGNSSAVTQLRGTSSARLSGPPPVAPPGAVRSTR
jgi:hypothetical protein